MKKIPQHIAVSLCAMILVFASCRRDEARVIPRDQLAEIYAEMLVMDQWIMTTPGVRLIADTSLVYAPLLEKYGYNTEDYRKTVDVYMSDPERFAKVFRTTGEMLESRLKDLKERRTLMEIETRKRKERLRLWEMYKSDYNNDDFFPYISTEPYIHYYDSLTFEADSALNVYRLVPVETTDSTAVI